MEPYETHLGLATALAVGLLVGLEREQTSKDRAGRHLAGIRTYPLVALVGAVSTLLANTSQWIPLISLLGILALVAISYAADMKRPEEEGGHGMTTEVSVIAVYLLGGLACASGVIEPMETRFVLVAAVGVAITFLLSSQPMFHGFAKRISRDDFYATVKFLIVAVIALPLLPDQDLGPLRAINPRSVGWMVVVISGLSFLGYVAIKLWGAKRGLLLGAALGGLVSSTATTLSFANRAKATPELAPVAAGAIAISWSVMLARVGVLIALIDLPLLRVLGIPLGAMIVAAIVGVALTFRRDGKDNEQLPLANPFELSSAIKVSLMFAAVQVLIAAAIKYLGEQGLYLAAALSGTTDVDAVTLSTARLAKDGLSDTTATIAIVIAIVANTIVKTGMAVSIGGKPLGKRVAITGGLMTIAAAGGLGVAAL